MKRIRSILRGREGMTLVELVVGAGLLCLVIGIFSASLRPAAEVSRRTQELNSAELIADDLLETVRSKVETATDYIKCYDSGTDVTNKTGSSEGSAIEFGYETEQGYNERMQCGGKPARPQGRCGEISADGSRGPCTRSCGNSRLSAHDGHPR